jgi:hypothetical protein
MTKLVKTREQVVLGNARLLVTFAQPGDYGP